MWERWENILDWKRVGNGKEVVEFIESACVGKGVKVGECVRE